MSLRSASLEFLALDLTLPTCTHHSQEHERRRDLYDRGQAGEFVIEDDPKLKEMPDLVKSTMKMFINVLTGG